MIGMPGTRRGQSDRELGLWLVGVGSAEERHLATVPRGPNGRMFQPLLIVSRSGHGPMW